MDGAEEDGPEAVVDLLQPDPLEQEEATHTGLPALPAMASRTLDEATWNNTRLLEGDAVAAVKELKAEDGKDVYVFGSADLLASLLAAGLVDEYRICLAPVVLGDGVPLFKPQDRQLKMRLEGTRPLKTGGVVLTYAVEG